MRILIIWILFQTLCWISGFGANPRWSGFGTPIPAHTNLEVRWDIPEKTFPPEVWIYRLLPNDFSPSVISNMMSVCSITDRDKIKQTAEGLGFRKPNGTDELYFYFPSGAIQYETAERSYSPTNLAVAVPTMSELPELTSNLLKQINIPLSAVTGYFQTDKFNLWEPLTLYYVGHTTITNIEFRAVNFRRTVDGIPIVAGDGGRIYFGEHAQLNKFSITWHNMERIKSFLTVSRKNVADFLKDGKAIQGLLPDNVPDIDWSTVKNVSVKKAWPSYYSGKTDLLYPYLALWATVDTGQGDVDVEIDCPIFDETKVSDSSGMRAK